MSYKNELAGAELSLNMQNMLNEALFGISELEQGELRLNNGSLARLDFSKPNYRNLSETEED